MGTSCSSVHIFYGGHPSRQTHKDASQAIESYLENIDEPRGTDQSFYLATTGNNKWCSIYMDTIDNFDELAKYLSKALDRPVISLLMIDSDSLILALFELGKCQSRLMNQEAKEDAPKLKPIENLDGWTALLKRPASIKTIPALWKSTPESGIDSLIKFSGLIDLPTEHSLSMGYDLEPDEMPFEKVTFECRPKKRNQARVIAENYTIPESLEIFTIQKKSFSLYFRVTGSNSQGLTVGVAGDLVKQGCVKVETVSVEMTYPNSRIETPSYFEAKRFRALKTNKGAALVATFEDIDLPSSGSEGPASLGAANLHLTFPKPGNGTLYFLIFRKDAPDSPAYWETELAIFSADE